MSIGIVKDGSEPIVGTDTGVLNLGLDPTYTSGLRYAQQIAGGLPMSQVIAPGVSYSPSQPMGYTQADLLGTAGVTPPPPPDRDWETACYLLRIS